MGRGSEAPAMNDGGVVVALVVLVGALAMTMVGALSLYTPT